MPTVAVDPHRVPHRRPLCAAPAGAAAAAGFEGPKVEQVPWWKHLHEIRAVQARGTVVPVQYQTAAAGSNMRVQLRGQNRAGGQGEALGRGAAST